MDNTVFFCCMLHNRLLVADGLDSIGLRATDWLLADVEMDDIRLQRDAQMAVSSHDEARLQQDEEERNWTRMHEEDAVDAIIQESVTTPEDQQAHEELREALIEHYKHTHLRQEILWLKTAQQCRHRARLLFEAEARSSGAESDEEEECEAEMQGLEDSDFEEWEL
eukprot:6185812-Pleurochrysis_carterae.AAC.1